MRPVSLTDSQLDAVIRACVPLTPENRELFLVDLANSLQGQNLGDGVVYRVIREVQKRYFDPPHITEDSYAMRHVRPADAIKI